LLIGRLGFCGRLEAEGCASSITRGCAKRPPGARRETKPILDIPYGTLLAQ
jgi:hypothetical protein